MLGCDVIGLQETRSPGRTDLAAVGYRMFCGKEAGSSGRPGQHGAGLAVKEFIVRKVDTGAYEQAPNVDEYQLGRQVQWYHVCCGTWPDSYCVQYTGTEGCVLGGFG